MLFLLICHFLRNSKIEFHWFHYRILPTFPALMLFTSQHIFSFLGSLPYPYYHTIPQQPQALPLCTPTPLFAHMGIIPLVSEPSPIVHLKSNCAHHNAHALVSTIKLATFNWRILLEGGAGGSPCVFPFTYKGVQYSTCSNVLFFFFFINDYFALRSLHCWPHDVVYYTKFQTYCSGSVSLAHGAFR